MSYIDHHSTTGAQVCEFGPKASSLTKTMMTNSGIINIEVTSVTTTNTPPYLSLANPLTPGFLVSLSCNTLGEALLHAIARMHEVLQDH